MSPAEVLSGVETSDLTVPIDTEALGLRTVDVTAADLAGNETTASCDYEVTVAVSSIFPAFDDGTSTTWRAGVVLPLTFQIADANGDRIQRSIVSNAELSFQSVDCSTGGATGNSVAARRRVRPLLFGYWAGAVTTNRSWRRECSELQLTFTGESTPHASLIRWR